MISRLHRLHEFGNVPQATRNDGAVRAFARRALAGLSNRQALAPQRVVVLGLGNVQWGDAGVGVLALEQLKTNWQCPAQVELVEGGTRGRALLPIVESTQHLIVLTAIDFGLAPGALRVLTGDAAAERLYSCRPSRPGMGFADALACAQLSGRSPREFVLIGVQPQAGDCYGAGLSSTVCAQLDATVEAARSWLQRWRAAPLPRIAQP
ncbi:hydrogenase maturation protease [Paraburkholderia acidiphila]|uniref:Hydrogenase maturation protease n=1 Tax=Paraburkholderia acidiphila TaxID=2571747 RepID=A0A7Z2G3L1_9BURK|nr:hydrogenase maturation protease [Paraburkholderia acidiphila]QGZ54340.1 hydrogenase maturation protease [Paraburkholderia acidiphila]